MAYGSTPGTDQLIQISPGAQSQLSYLTGGYSEDDLKYLGLTLADGKITSPLLDKYFSNPKSSLYGGLSTNPDIEAWDGVRFNEGVAKLLKTPATKIQGKLASGGTTITSDGGQNYASNLNPFKGSSWSQGQAGIDQLTQALAAQGKTFAQYAYEINQPLPNTVVNGVPAYDPTLAPNPDDLILNPGLKESLDRKAQMDEYNSILQNLFSDGGNNTMAPPLVAATQQPNNDIYSYLTSVLGQYQTPTPAAPSTAQTLPNVSGLISPTSVLSDIFKTAAPEYDKILSTLTGPRSTDQVRKELEDSLLAQQETQINRGVDQALASTRLDFLDRGLGGPGRTSDIEQNALAQVRSGGVDTLAKLRSEAALQRLGQIEQRDTADRQAAAAINKEKLNVFTSLMKEGVLSEADMQRFLLGEQNKLSEGAATRSQNSKLALADLVGKGFLQSQDIASREKISSNQLQTQLDLAAIEDAYRRAAMIEDRNTKLQIAQLSADQQKAALDAQNSWSSFFKNIAGTYLNSAAQGYGQRTAAM